VSVPIIHRVVVIDLTDYDHMHEDTIRDQARESAGAWVEVRLNDEAAASFDLPRTVAIHCTKALGFDLRGGGRMARYFEETLRHAFKDLAADLERQKAPREGGAPWPSIPRP